MDFIKSLLPSGNRSGATSIHDSFVSPSPSSDDLSYEKALHFIQSSIKTHFDTLMRSTSRGVPVSDFRSAMIHAQKMFRDGEFERISNSKDSLCKTVALILWTGTRQDTNIHREIGRNSAKVFDKYYRTERSSQHVSDGVLVDQDWTQEGGKRMHAFAVNYVAHALHEESKNLQNASTIQNARVIEDTCCRGRGQSAGSLDPGWYTLEDVAKEAESVCGRARYVASLQEAKIKAESVDVQALLFGLMAESVRGISGARDGQQQ